MISDDFKLPSIHNKSMLNTNTASVFSVASSKKKEKLEACSQIYGQRISRSTSSKNSVPKNQKTQPKHYKRSSVIDVKPIQLQEKKPVKSKTVSHEDIWYNIQKATSDLIELKRDLSTYEFNLFNQTQLSGKLAQIAKISDQISALDSSFVQQMSQDAAMYQKIQEQMTNTKIDPSLDSRHTDDAELYIPQGSVTANDLDCIFQGTTDISGQKFLISIRAGKWLEKLDIDAHCSLGIWVNLTYKINLGNFSVERIHEFLAKLYLKHSHKHGFMLKISNSHRVSFVSLLCRVKRLGLCCVILEETSETEVSIKVEELQLQVTVTTQELQCFHGVLNEPLPALRRKISKHLYFNKELIWVNDTSQNPIFELKEEKSTLLNDGYIQEVMKDYNYTFRYSIVHSFMGFDFRIDVFKFKNMSNLKITHREQTIELAYESKQLKFLIDLQELNLSNHPKTLCSSLELNVLLLKLFPSISQPISR